MKFLIPVLFFTGILLSAGPLADFSAGFSDFFIPETSKGAVKTERITEQGKQYFCIKADAQRAVYAALVLHHPRKIKIADEFVVECNLFIPKRRETVIVAMHIVDSRGKLYVFNRDIQFMSAGPQKILYRFTKNSTFQKNGKMQFPVYFRGFGFLFKKLAPGQSSRIALGKIDLIKGEDEITTGWMSVKNKILSPDPFYISAPVLKNGKQEMGGDAIRMTLSKGTNFFETTKRGNNYPLIRKIRLDLNLKSGAVTAKPVLIDAASRKFPAAPVALKKGRHTYSFEFKENKTAPAPFHYGIEFISKDGKSEIDLYDVSLNVPMRTVDAIEVGKTTQPAGLILPETKDRKASISFKNNLETAVQTEIKLVLRDSFQTLKTENLKLSFAPDETKTFRMPEMKRDGIYYIDYEITIPGKQGIKKGHNSFVLLHPSGPASEKSPFTFGICYHMQRFSREELKLAGEVLSKIGIGTIRGGSPNWRGTQKGPDQPFNFSGYEYRKQLFGKYNINFLAGVQGCPVWAKNKTYIPVPQEKFATNKWYPDRNLPDYAAFGRWVHADAEYGKDSFKFIETWNEPELIGSANFSPDECAKLQKITYTEVKKASPKIMVTTPGFVCARPRAEFTDPRYMEKMLAASKGYYDVVLHHGHDSFDFYQQDIQYLLDMKKKLGIEKIPWIAGETGIPNTNISEYEQGLVLFKKLNFAYANGCVGYFWYDMKNDGVDPLNAEHTFGLFTYDFQPKAVFAIYNTLTSALKCVNFEKNLSADGIFMYRFNSGKQVVYTFWNDSDITPERLFWLPGKKAEFSDVFGNKSYPKDLITLTMHPGILRMEKNASADPVPVWKLNQARFNPNKSVFVSLTFRNPFAKELEMRVNGKTFKVAGKTSKTVQIDSVKVEKTGKTILPFEIPSMKFKSQIVIWPKTELTIPLAGFRSVPDLKIDQSKQMNRLTINAPGMHHLWRNKNDFSADVYFGRTQTSLLMKCVVTDDIHHQPYKGGDVWRADNLQLLLLLPGQKNSWEIGFTCLKNGQPEVFCWSKGDYNAPSKLISLKAKRDESKKQTVYEAEIPWKALGVTKTPPYLKFNLLCNENDGTVRKVQATAFGNSKDCKDPNKFRILNFQ